MSILEFNHLPAPSRTNGVVFKLVAQTLPPAYIVRILRALSLNCSTGDDVGLKITPESRTHLMRAMDDEFVVFYQDVFLEFTQSKTRLTAAEIVEFIQVCNSRV